MEQFEITNPFHVRRLVIGRAYAAQEIVVYRSRYIGCRKPESFGDEVGSLHLPQWATGPQIGYHPTRHADEIRICVQLIEPDNPPSWLQLSHHRKSKWMALQDAPIITFVRPVPAYRNGAGRISAGWLSLRASHLDPLSPIAFPRRWFASSCYHKFGDDS